MIKSLMNFNIWKLGVIFLSAILLVGFGVFVAGKFNTNVQEVEPKVSYPLVSENDNVTLKSTPLTKTPSQTSTPSPTAARPPSPTATPTPTLIPKPSTSDGRNLVESQIKAESEGFIKLLAFEKTNGVDREIGGTKLYEMDYTADIEFLDNCRWISSSFIAWKYYAPDPRLIPDLPQRGERVISIGTRTKVNGKLMFEMTEKGWRLIQ